jgi:hypothetical protein
MEVMSYTPETGVFTWAVDKGPARSGDEAGTPQSAGYVYIRIDGTKYLAHRLAFLYMTGKWPEAYVDHINHVRTDNRWENLRIASRADNMRNASRYVSNSSGHHGVSWKPRDKIWVARICVDGRNIHIGSFRDIESAVVARKAAERMHGFHANHGAK